MKIRQGEYLEYRTEGPIVFTLLRATGAGLYEDDLAQSKDLDWFRSD